MKLYANKICIYIPFFFFPKQGKVPLLSLEGLHHLHIFIFVLAVVHVVFCVTTMILGGARVINWGNDILYEADIVLTSKNISPCMNCSVIMFVFYLK